MTISPEQAMEAWQKDEAVRHLVLSDSCLKAADGVQRAIASGQKPGKLSILQKECMKSVVCVKTMSGAFELWSVNPGSLDRLRESFGASEGELAGQWEHVVPFTSSKADISGGTGVWKAQISDAYAESLKMENIAIFDLNQRSADAYAATITAITAAMETARRASLRAIRAI